MLGKQNVQPDFLSRYGYSDGDCQAADSRQDSQEVHINAVLARSSASILPERLAEATAQDPTLCRVKDFVEGGWPAVTPAELKPTTR